eukprot:Nk52_evm1s462 gene=Nk52_evmTU1s462
MFHKITNHQITNALNKKSTPALWIPLVIIFLLISSFCIGSSHAAVFNPILDLFRGPAKGNNNRKCVDWVDPDTPLKDRQTVARTSGNVMKLVFSDEFNSQDRDFSTQTSDNRWVGTDIYSWLTADDEVYTPEMLKMNFGSVRMSLEKYKTCYPAPSGNLICRPFKGGQMTTWNKFCFTGGRIEYKVKLPGAATMPGYWPALWLMGNLGRAGYGATLDGTFPYGYDHCDPGVYPTNSSLPDASSSCMRGQRVNKCNTKYKAPFGMNRNQGRGSPEIDILEISPGTHGVLVSSYQISPKEPFYFDGTGYYPYKTNTSAYKTKPYCHANDWAGSHVQDAVSAIYPLNGTHWVGWHTFGVEWYPSQNLTFFMDEDVFFSFDMSAIKAKKGFGEEGYPEYISQRQVSEELPIF